MDKLPPAIGEHLEAIRALCVEHHIKSLTLFGSAARGDDFDPERSDADFLVEFLPDAPRKPWLGHFFGFQDALESLLGRKVDLLMPGAIENPYLKRAIYECAVPLYVAA